MPLVTERNRKWWTVVAMALATLMMTIDFNGITAALPNIGRDLDTSTAGLQWTINAYLLALAAPSVAAGRLADIFGRRRVLLIGTFEFVIGSAGSGLAQANWWLISARGCWRRLLARAHPNGVGDTMWASDNEGFHAVLEIWVVFCCMEWEQQEGGSVG
jgi:MFS family permease